MGNVTQRVKYICEDDCKVDGCPSHEAFLTFHSVSNTYTFNDGAGSWIHFDNTTLGALIKMVKIFEDTRADTVNVTRICNSIKEL